MVSGRYRGKRMRIDYFIAAEKLKDRIVACEMHGLGIEQEGVSNSMSNITSVGWVGFFSGVENYINIASSTPPVSAEMK